MALIAASSPSHSAVLDPESFKPLIEQFNANDNEIYKNAIPNAEAWDFLPV